ncbi:hypothetical protein K458DRAFT_182095 [Lentithecium fluviatile CBS 122367]|uniref:Uncharacterized protein n=1 Tax=Lentithecium fluviatile CBS 122367 TaxID=1168545 RepID=A0A6G1IEN9_9PLEO|nr:hypothetical protein K458DRAFT_182095 [Lentithecium fluviatile CBS 122367]
MSPTLVQSPSPRSARLRRGIRPNLSRPDFRLSVRAACTSGGDEPPTPTSDKTTRNQITRLPRVVRERIYTLVFADMPNALTLCYRPMCCLPTAKFPLDILPGLCRTNRQIFTETIPLLLHGKTITIANTPSLYALCSLLTRVPDNEAYKAIKTLHFETSTHWMPFQHPIFSRLPYYGFEMVVRCTNLRELTIEIDAADLYTWHGTQKSLMTKGELEAAWKPTAGAIDGCFVLGRLVILLRASAVLGGEVGGEVGGERLGQVKEASRRFVEVLTEFGEGRLVRITVVFRGADMKTEHFMGWE